MSKQEFLAKLNRQLKCLKKAERKKYIEYYEEMISDIVESGGSEETVRLLFFLRENLEYHGAYI